MRLFRKVFRSSKFHLHLSRAFSILAVPMKHRALASALLSGTAIAAVLAVCATSCGKRNDEPSAAASPAAADSPAASDGKTPSLAVGTETGAETPAAAAPKGPRTHDDYVAALGAASVDNRSLARRMAMADEILSAREKVLREQSIPVQNAAKQVDLLRGQLSDVQKALADAEKALADALASDPEWSEAKAKADSIAAERKAAMARTAALIQDARKKGIRLTPPGSKSESPKAETPMPSTVGTAPAVPEQP